MSEPESRCAIADVGKSRDGRTRYWCRTHGFNATGPRGTRLERCEGAYRHLNPDDVLELDITRFPGGVAIWGAVSPIFNTTGHTEDTGVHVHARTTVEGSKDVDATYPAVSMRYSSYDLFETKRALVTRDTAVSFYLSRFIGNDVTCLFCTYCREPHLDAGWFAVKPHKKHLCHACGRFFSVDGRGVSNPIAQLRLEVEPHVVDQSPQPSAKTFVANQSDFPGGIEIWASNPAVFWIAERPEESGIHVHAYDANGQRVRDDTFGEVVLDGHQLPREQVAYLMAQSNVGYLADRVVSLSCNACGTAIFDKGLAAFTPAGERVCPGCGGRVRPRGRNRLVVSNPLVAVLEQLKANAGRADEGLYLHHWDRNRPRSAKQSQ